MSYPKLGMNGETYGRENGRYVVNVMAQMVL